MTVKTRNLFSGSDFGNQWSEGKTTRLVFKHCEWASSPVMCDEADAHVDDAEKLISYRKLCAILKKRVRDMWNQGFPRSPRACAQTDWPGWPCISVTSPSSSYLHLVWLNVCNCTLTSVFIVAWPLTPLYSMLAPNPRAIKFRLGGAHVPLKALHPIDATQKEKADQSRSNQRTPSLHLSGFSCSTCSVLEPVRPVRQEPMESRCFLYSCSFGLVLPPEDLSHAQQTHSAHIWGQHDMTEKCQHESFFRLVRARCESQRIALAHVYVNKSLRCLHFSDVYLITRATNYMTSVVHIQEVFYSSYSTAISY